ncbi:hypothetical protein [Stenotrophomonas maltophilia]|uniref:hypothetical protein n=1 Tax=Stenotrophomonas maltophilia TaxID=40324 RepID=UPI00066CFB4C|nr:hypothetical protein [Stenotrophomonas maltophilia]
MARQVIDTTTDHGSYKGDPAKVAFDKVNANDAELYALLAGLAGVGGDNMLISCGIPVNQAGFSGGAVAAGAYGYDIWKAGTGGCNVTINATTGVFTHTSGPLQQVVESPLLAWGQPLTISVENPSGNVSVSVGGATGTITAGTGRRGVTVTPSGSGNMVVQLTATGVTYSRPKLERGSVATPFVPVPLALDLAMVQRYFEVGTIYLFGCVGASGGWNGVQCDFKVQKRATPAMVYAPAENSTNIAQTIPTVTRSTLSVRGIPVTINQNFIYIGGFTADARL